MILSALLDEMKIPHKIQTGYIRSKEDEYWINHVWVVANQKIFDVTAYYLILTLQIPPHFLYKVQLSKEDKLVQNEEMKKILE